MNEVTPRILVVEDEQAMAELICENLLAEGFEAQSVGDGTEGLAQARAGAYDLLVLDVMLPGLDGFAVCEQLRQEGIDVPVLFLTAKGTADDRIRGLEAGGDDYLAKPFHLREFLLRVNAILRRRPDPGPAGAPTTQLEFGGNQFDFLTYRGQSWDGAEQLLTHKEAMILKALSDREGEVVQREELMETVWGLDVYPSTRTLDTFVVRLRKRFEPDPNQPRHLHTASGLGYRFTKEPT